MKQDERKQKSEGSADIGKAPGRPKNAPERIPGQGVDKQNAKQAEKDGGVEEDGRGRLTR